jgi:hypothetical protein
MAMRVWERERKRMLRCNSADRGCVACSGQHYVAGNGADFSPVLALETVYGTDAGSKANDDGALPLVRAVGAASHTPGEFSIAVRIGCSPVSSRS